MKFERQYKWLEVVGSYSPDVASSISAHVASILESDSAIPRKYKELVLLACSTALRSEGSVRSHGLAAMRHGASEHEVLEAISLAALPSGYSAFIEAIEVLGDKLVKNSDQKAATQVAD